MEEFSACFQDLDDPRIGNAGRRLLIPEIRVRISGAGHWTKITRPHYERNGQRYASDMTDTEGDIVAPCMPPARRTGRPRTTDLRDVLDAIFCLAR